MIKDIIFDKKKNVFSYSCVEKITKKKKKLETQLYKI